MGLLSRQTSKASRTGPVTDCQGCSSFSWKSHLTPATWETGPATPWCLEPAYQRAWMFKFRKWKLAMQGLTIRYMLQNVCQIRCIYESHVILLFCFMASRGIFGRQGLACMTDIDPETFLVPSSFYHLIYFSFILPLLRWTLCFSLSIIRTYGQAPAGSRIFNPRISGTGFRQNPRIS